MRFRPTGSTPTCPSGRSTRCTASAISRASSARSCGGAWARRSGSPEEVAANYAGLVVFDRREQHWAGLTLGRDFPARPERARHRPLRPPVRVLRRARLHRLRAAGERLVRAVRARGHRRRVDRRPRCAPRPTTASSTVSPATPPTCSTTFPRRSAGTSSSGTRPRSSPHPDKQLAEATGTAASTRTGTCAGASTPPSGAHEPGGVVVMVETCAAPTPTCSPR